jgi:hypothetical protein
MIAAWGRRLAGHGVSGCLAYRFALGFVATGKGADLARLSDKDLLFLEPERPSAESWVAHGAAAAPAAWWVLATVFADRGSAIFAFLAEGEEWARAAAAAGAPAVGGASGDRAGETVAKIEAALGRGNALALEGVGALALGSTADDAGLDLLRLLGKG